MSEYFDGETFDYPRDTARLTSQLFAVRDFMLRRFPAWATLEEIATGIGAGESSVPAISARLRDLRKVRFGNFIVERRYVSKGLWQYRVLLKPESIVLVDPEPAGEGRLFDARRIR